MAEKYALISVSDKRGVVDFARKIVAAGYGLLSTGGTARALEDAGLAVTRVSEVTGFPEILDGRVKTLHPKIHGALLARRDIPAHQETLDAHGIRDIRLVVVNLYPFRQTVARPETRFEEAVEQIDIGGPTLLRASAKNHGSIAVVVDSQDYMRVGEALAAGRIGAELRRELALKAFRHTADYDAAIVAYLDGELAAEDAHSGAGGEDGGEESALPSTLSLALQKSQSLRYGENPHQAAALYARGSKGGPARAELGGIEKLHGKSLSYNNIVDLDAALELVREFSAPGCAIIKHTNPAGCALGTDLIQAYERALACDATSAFGGIVALNRPVSEALAQRLDQHFFEIIAAPEFEPAALEILQRKKNLRLLKVPEGFAGPEFAIRATALGYLVQQTDPRIADFAGLEASALHIPTEREPSADEIAALEFVWKVCKHVKSNAIVLGLGTQTVGVGAGQMSRVDAVELAVKKSHQDLKGAVLASDAFFPFRDGVDAAAAAGVRGIIQPGGSRRDSEVIEACNEHGIAMIFTGKRHFRH